MTKKLAHDGFSAILSIKLTEKLSLAKQLNGTFPRGTFVPPEKTKQNIIIMNKLTEKRPGGVKKPGLEKSRH